MWNLKKQQPEFIETEYSGGYQGWWLWDNGGDVDQTVQTSS